MALPGPSPIPRAAGEPTPIFIPSEPDGSWRKIQILPYAKLQHVAMIAAISVVLLALAAYLF